MRDKKFYKEQTGDNRFYVYIHRKAANGEPFYVGKGKGVRAWRTDRNNPYWQNVYKKHGRSVDIVFDDLSEEDAFQIEKDVILELKYFGHELTNLTDGGDGPSGYVYSDESRKRMSESQKTSEKVKVAREKVSNARKGVKTGPKPNISKALKGRPKSAEHVAKVAEARRDKRLHAFYNTQDGTFEVCTRRTLSDKSKLLTRDISGLFCKSPTKVAKGWMLIQVDVTEDFQVTDSHIQACIEVFQSTKKRTEEVKVIMSAKRKEFLHKNPEHQVRNRMTDEQVNDLNLRTSERNTNRVISESHKKVLSEQRMDKRIHVFKNLNTEEVFKGTRTEFSFHTGIDRNYISRFFSRNKLKKVKNWVLVEEESC